MENLVNIGIIISYAMVAFAALASIGFGIKKMIKNTNNAKKTMYTLIGLVLAFAIAYLVASDEVLKSFEKYETTAAASKRVGMGLITFYLLLIGAVGSVFYAELSKVFSK
tara:strand:- start:26 stop:355 length:330 start_codon:yes stop_codon:yes gene_type:complete